MRRKFGKVQPRSFRDMRLHKQIDTQTYSSQYFERHLGAK